MTILSKVYTSPRSIINQPSAAGVAPSTTCQAFSYLPFVIWKLAASLMDTVTPLPSARLTSNGVSSAASLMNVNFSFEARVPFSLVTDIGPVVVFSLTMALIVVSSIISKLSAFLPSKATSVAVEKLTPTIVTSVPALPSMGSNESTFGNLDTVNGELSNGLAP